MLNQVNFFCSPMVPPILKASHITPYTNSATIIKDKNISGRRPPTSPPTGNVISVCMCTLMMLARNAQRPQAVGRFARAVAARRAPAPHRWTKRCAALRAGRGGYIVVKFAGSRSGLANCANTSCRLIPFSWLNVNTIAPIIATNNTKLAIIIYGNALLENNTCPIAETFAGTVTTSCDSIVAPTCEAASSTPLCVGCAYVSFASFAQFAVCRSYPIKSYISTKNIKPIITPIGTYREALSAISTIFILSIITTNKNKIAIAPT